jgi:hypothetical protein
VAVEDWEHYSKYRGIADELAAAIQAKIRGEATPADVALARKKLDDFLDEVDA